MALVASGAIALSDVNVELGFSSTATIALNDAAVRTLFGIASGAISMSDGYSKANTLGYVEDVFSTYNYTGDGNAASVTITNGINLSGNGGLVWIKSRDQASDHKLVDTVRGASSGLSSNLSDAASTPFGFSSFSSSGFVVSNNYPNINQTGVAYVSWSFRKAQKFFDIVTYTGNGTNNRAISHNLGSTPGFIIAKRTNSALSWFCYHTSLGVGKYIALNQTAASVTNADAFPAVSSTTFTPVNDANQVGLNTNGDTYVAYLFAHNAGGYGATGTDNIVSCGSFNTNGATTTTVNLGYEPQWLMVKLSNGTSNWHIFDNMRGLAVGGNDASLSANVSSAESSADYIVLTATGFDITTSSNFNNASETYIYIAIRRGPMKVPTVGTSVYNAIAWTGNASNPRSLTGVGFAPDNTFFQIPSLATNWNWYDRLRGPTRRLISNSQTSEAVRGTGVTSFNMDGITFGSDYNNDGFASQTWFFKRAPSFFDVVCYTGTGVAGLTVAHNLTVVPEFMIVKGRSIAEEWNVYYGVNTNYIVLNQASVTNPATSRWNDTSPTSSVFSLGDSGWVNFSGSTYVAYLFATCAGVSKVGSYTGTGALQTVNCGFTSGARFILIKRTDSTGAWYVWDSVRGISSGNDPYLFLNSTAAEVTNTNYVDTHSTGFQVTAAAPAALNASGGNYIFLAIA
jgi:hypothetical protein